MFDFDKKEKITDIVSRITRTTALALAVALIFAAGSLFQFQKEQIEKTYDQVDLSASLINDTQNNRRASVLRNNILQGYHDALKKHLYGIPGAGRFLKDVEQWKDIKQLQVNSIESGIMVSLEGNTTESDVLHPFYGFFKMDREKITEIVWGGISEGLIRTIDEIREQNIISISVVNNGPYPWLQSDKWQNSATGDDVIHIAPKGKVVTEPGETGVFVFPTHEKLLLKNNSRGFPVILKQD